MNNNPHLTQADAIELAARAFHEATARAVLRFLSGRRAVLEGRINSRPAIFRVALSDQEASRLDEMWTELKRIGPAMSDGTYRVNQGLEYSREHGVLAVSKADGSPFLSVIAESRDETLMGHLSDWLHTYAAPSLTTRNAAPAFWLKQAEASSSRQPHSDLREKELLILAAMQGFAENLRGQPWSVAITHGDFHPNNLLWDGNILTGIDTGGSAYLPIYKDIARSLVHLARRDVFCGQEKKFGVDSSGLAAFANSFSLTETEMKYALPFFIGFECLIRVEQPDAPDWRLRASHALYDGYLESVA